MKKYNVLLIALLFAASCGDKDSPTGPADDGRESPVTFGVRHDRTLEEYEAVATNQAPYNTAAYPDFSPVVMFKYSLDGSDYSSDDNDGFSLASGTLIAPDWILTAAHSFFDSDDEGQEELVPTSGITVLVGNDPNNPISTHAVAELVFHPTWIEHNDAYGYANDLCLVRLAEPILSIGPAPLNLEPVESVGSTVWAAGFGDYSEQEGQDIDLCSLKHAYENILDRVNDGIITSDDDGNSYNGGLLVFDFDSPWEDVNTLGDDYISEDEPLFGDGASEAAATEFEGSTVEGDSGGPLFVRLAGEWRVAGVLAGSPEAPVEGHVGNDYGEISVFTRVAPYREWILETTGL